MGRPSAMRVARLHLARKSVLDREWIDTVRKSFGREIVRQSLRGVDSAEVRERLGNLIAWLDALAEDLLFAKGFWQEDTEDDSNRSIVGRAKANALRLLKEVREILSEAVSTILFTERLMDSSTHEYKLDGGYFLQAMQQKDPRSPRRALDENSRVRAGDAIERASRVFSRKFLRALTVFVTEFGQDGSTGDLLQSIDREFSLGRVKVVLQDLPYRESGGPLTTTKRPWGKSLRDPFDFRLYLRRLDKAKALLERHGLGFLWYGHILIQPSDAGGTNPHGADFGVGADYSPTRDEIRIFSDPHAWVTGLVIHELGHRYYYRFMDDTDRARFDAHFAGTIPRDEYNALVRALIDWAGDFAQSVASGQVTGVDPEQVTSDIQAMTRTHPVPATVMDFASRYRDHMTGPLRESVDGLLARGGVPATSVYGQQSSVEDFAEVFAAYVTGEGLTPDQRGRLKAFFGRTQKHGSEGFDDRPEARRRPTRPRASDLRHHGRR